MEISFVAGFGPIVRDLDAAREFWRDVLGIAFEEVAADYFHARDLDGVKVFALWPLSQAAESTFGTPTWPASLPVPQAWLELDVADHEAVAQATVELSNRGFDLLRGAELEPWGQTTSRLLSPEGLLVGISHTPWLHDRSDDQGAQD